MAKDFVEGEGDQCGECGRYTVLDAEEYLCEECFTAGGYADDEGDGSGEGDEEVEESDD